ncbi:MAG: hypothetical protein KKD29_02130, partial [Candidatus Omnitrophica bacterium]|nr:hypothetical protein [Candidatus Omnitrophota bacterium]
MKETDITLNRVMDKDCRDLWTWRNHPEVRRQFFDDKIIPWDEHQRWFHSKTNSPGTKIYMASLQNNKIGAIRFEINGDIVTVSANLNPIFF